ncbi:hlh transcription factor [Niveomyces insectorum RCEF 264]|uniref:Hlh transcription factor n=1 Tax=Niveomyces insectorum RCEF 264 TaxID=1081102 RepID=A0A167NU82_9HYPO|nr:hlh transcription factor [Niveomyces insectorum RCEF 264]
MASGRDADPHQNPLPFGYFVEEFPFTNAPEPPHGAPLLSDHENKALDSFFEDMTADSAMFGTASTPADGLVYSDAWLDLPPQFMGSTSFFGHTPDPFRASPDLHDFLPAAFPDMTSLSPSFAMLPPPPPLPQQQQQQQQQQRQQHQQQPSLTENIPRTPSLAASSFSPSRPTSSSPVAPAALSATAARHTSPLLGSGSSAAEQQPSADVLEAASVLQNGSLGSRSEPGLHFGISSSSSSSASSAAFVHPQNPFLSSSQNDTTAAQILSLASRSASTSTTSPSALFSPPEAATATATAADATTGARRTSSFSSSTKALHNPRTELLWGSDQSFNHVQFTPRSARETSEALVNQHLKSMQCLEVNRSADSTRPSSPAAATSFDAALVPLHLKTRTASMVAEKPNGTKVARTAPPRKRRKGKAAVKVEEAEQDVLDLDSDGLDAYQANGNGDGGDGANNRNGNGDDDDDNDNNGGGGDGDVTTNGKGNKPRKRKATKASTNGHLPLSPSAAAMTSPRDTLSGSPIAFGGSGSANGDGHGDESAAGQQRRRRRSAAQAKPPRENLTEDQKRENHIKSEQKRRTLIKSGFDDLCDLVPSLHGGGFSKSVMLTMAADWLEELLRGNEVLREQLQRTGG